MKLKSAAAALSLSLALMSSTAIARPMITDLSDRKIKINAKFSGKEILVYGARVEAGNLVVVVRGPSDNYIVRKKENIGGIWVNTSSVEFVDVPQFYYVASSTSLPKLDSEVLLKALGVGIDTVRLEGKPSSSKVDINEFESALIGKMGKDGMFYFDVVNLPFLEGTLFRIWVDFPSKISKGVYTAEIYSFNDGQLTGMQSIPIVAKKAGIEAVISDSAHNYPALYGLFSIFVAVFTGLAAGRYFKRF